MSDKKIIVTVIGSGTIGMSWAALFATNGYHVRLNDVRPDFATAIAGRLKEMIAQISDDPDTAFGRISFHTDLAEALEGTMLVQENGPENPAFKQKMFADLEAMTGADTMLVSSSSGITPDVIGAQMKDPARVMIGHPLNPPHMVRLVEICGATGADDAVVERLMAFYEDCGRVSVRLNKPIPGFVVNRLQVALVREAIHIISEGVVDVEGLDKIVVNSLGVRYASIGPMLTAQLGGGQGGLREMVEKILAGLVAALNLPPVDAETVALLDAQASATYPLDRIAEFGAVRDVRQSKVIAMQDETPLPKAG
ncbi:3-hydroxyacyl-CoA dehydrogenase NAD-binding domain-containing protein [Martelella sp. HB161492]|uniref:3-hydroxyacyl-CoA dehydrogenase NAD-binding domain-containing protein n=1 Tax=Martelella sp. HB161492 TaxID=2720726 RepID=UPI001591929F|nr:3-hydroxyacyl-CoA dehydrogenase NAD-binding domain-containing protein [Martelella sp. HB161492]